MIRFLCVSAAMMLLPAASFSASLTLAEAAKREDKAAVRSLLEQKADVNAPLPDGTTALHWAVETDDLATVDLLIQALAEALQNRVAGQAHEIIHPVPSAPPHHPPPAEPAVGPHHHLHLRPSLPQPLDQ